MALAPAWYAPASLATVLPTFMLAASSDFGVFDPIYYAPVSAFTLHVLFSLPLLFLKAASQRQWVTVLFCVIAVSNTAWIATNLQAGISHQGLPYVVSVAAVNAIWMGLLAYLIFDSTRSLITLRRPIVSLSLIMLCSVWFAFPWLGETL